MATIDIYDKGQVDTLLAAKADTADLPSADELLPDYSGASADDVLTIENGAPVWKAGGGSGGNDDYDIVISPEIVTLADKVSMSGTSKSSFAGTLITGCAINGVGNPDVKISAPMIFKAHNTATLTGSANARTGQITNAADIANILSKITVKPNYSGSFKILAVQTIGETCMSGICAHPSNDETILTYVNGVLTSTPSSIMMMGIQGSTYVSTKTIIVHMVVNTDSFRT